MLCSGDVLVLAGKGHEQGQTLQPIPNHSMTYWKPNKPSKLNYPHRRILPPSNVPFLLFSLIPKVHFMTAQNISNTLWTSIEAAKANRRKTQRNWSVLGVSIDSRTVKRGDLFIAIRGDNSDGHDYAPKGV